MITRHAPTDPSFARVLAAFDACDPRDQPRTVGPYLADAAEPGVVAEWWLVEESGRGIAVGSLQARGTAEPAFVRVSTLPAERRRGHGRRLADHLWNRALELGAPGTTSLVSASPDDAAAVRAFVQATGYRVTDGYGIWLLDLPTTSAPAPHVPGYRLRTLLDSCPEDLLTARARLQEHFSQDVPSRTLDHSSAWDVERMRASYEQARDGIHLLEVVAEVDDGELVGYTRLLVRPDDDQAEQKDTFVARGHRGHGLGLAMKQAALAELARLAPWVTRVRTFVEADNAYMQGVNAMLGHRLDREAMEVYRAR